MGKPLRSRLLPLTLTAGIILNGFRIRDRLNRLSVLPDSGDPVHPDHAFLVAEQVQLSESAKRAASRHASRHGLWVLDLIPSNLRPERLVDVARMVDTRRFRQSRLAIGRGAFQALLVHRDVLARAHIDERDDYTPLELVYVTRQLKRFAPTTMELAVVPGFRTCHRDGWGDRIRLRRAAHHHDLPLDLLPVLRTIALGVSALADPASAALALVACWLQPNAVCAGRVPQSPRDLVRGPTARLLGWPAFLMGMGGRSSGRLAAHQTAAARSPTRPTDSKEAEVDERRRRYQTTIGAGLDVMFEPPRDSCPWCGSTALSPRLDAVDTMLRKPGRFRYEECVDCGHVFQNPRLAPTGLDFYYRDFYDGIQAELAQTVLGAWTSAYRDRARALPASARVDRWLDVGAAYGHFCLIAQELRPDVTFDALDLGDSVEDACRRRWVDRAYQGRFPDLLDEVAGIYDVISMFHYLEHTTDPYLELDTAASALRPGGYLVIEVPNPQAPAFRIYRGLWFNLCPPQHLHLMPANNLARALSDRGLEPVRVQFGRTHQPVDTTALVQYLRQKIQPNPDLPWLPDEATRWRWARRRFAVAATVPLYPLGALVDLVMWPYFLTGHRANAYRIVARKQISPHPGQVAG